MISLAGRDEGRIFAVLETDGEYAIIADGKLRKLDKPKRKKLKHMRVIASAGASEEVMMADSRLWKAIKAYKRL